MGQQKHNVSILGATGSVGGSTLDVLTRNSERFEIFALTAHTNHAAMAALCEQHQPQYAVMRDLKAAQQLRQSLKQAAPKTEVLEGDEGLNFVASCDAVDSVMAAIVGAAGLESSLAAARAGKRVLLANKESLVMSGTLFMDTVKTAGAELLPIDSEHNAIFQCLANGAKDYADGVTKILLTGSGGPLRTLPMAQLASVTPEQACAHPNWSMGRKISVDSATMMNKGLELIEAKWLFNTDPANIEIVIHPESTIHSMVQYIDGSVIAQLGNPDMRTPIAHGLGWPERLASGVAPLDLIAQAQLNFVPLDRQRFPLVSLAEHAARSKDSVSIALNAANEVAVNSFLHELIGFMEIPLVIEAALNRTQVQETPTIEDIVAVDQQARAYANEQLSKLS
jgi:1-deoxy-D-xylulose-5-phosphate reductoisomerase